MEYIFRWVSFIFLVLLVYQGLWAGRTIREKASHQPSPFKSLWDKQPPIQSVRQSANKPPRQASQQSVGVTVIPPTSQSGHSANPLVSQQASQLSSQPATHQVSQSTCQHVYQSFNLLPHSRRTSSQAKLQITSQSLSQPDRKPVNLCQWVNHSVSLTNTPTCQFSAAYIKQGWIAHMTFLTSSVEEPNH